jgi:hypothetical protein
VTDDRIDIREQIPEADLLEQQTPLDPHTPAYATPAPPSAGTPGEANEADRLEQQAAVPVDDEDDYQHEVLATG